MGSCMQNQQTVLRCLRQLVMSKDMELRGREDREKRQEEECLGRENDNDT